MGQVVGPVKFKAPITEDGAKYLGLAKADAFTLADVKAPYLLVEQFNTSCPHCIAQAPVMNALFAKVQADAQLKNKLKFLGAGQGNEVPQLKMWQGFHKVPFALVPDPDNSFGKALNFTPYRSLSSWIRPARSCSPMSGPSRAPTKSSTKSKL